MGFKHAIRILTFFLKGNQSYARTFGRVLTFATLGISLIMHNRAGEENVFALLSPRRDTWLLMHLDMSYTPFLSSFDVPKRPYGPLVKHKMKEIHICIYW